VKFGQGYKRPFRVPEEIKKKRRKRRDMA
jgi:hypothetical protein